MFYPGKCLIQPLPELQAREAKGGFATIGGCTSTKRSRNSMANLDLGNTLTSAPWPRNLEHDFCKG